MPIPYPHTLHSRPPRSCHLPTLLTPISTLKPGPALPRRTCPSDRHQSPNPFSAPFDPPGSSLVGPPVPCPFPTQPGPSPTFGSSPPTLHLCPSPHPNPNQRIPRPHFLIPLLCLPIHRLILALPNLSSLDPSPYPSSSSPNASIHTSLSYLHPRPPDPCSPSSCSTSHQPVYCISYPNLPPDHDHPSTPPSPPHPIIPFPPPPLRLSIPLSTPFRPQDLSLLIPRSKPLISRMSDLTIFILQLSNPPSS